MFCHTRNELIIFRSGKRIFVNIEFEEFELPVFETIKKMFHEEYSSLFSFFISE